MIFRSCRILENIKLQSLYFLIHNACYVTVIPVALRDNVVAVNTGNRCNMNAHTHQHRNVNHAQGSIQEKVFNLLIVNAVPLLAMLHHYLFCCG